MAYVPRTPAFPRFAAAAEGVFWTRRRARGPGLTLHTSGYPVLALYGIRSFKLSQGFKLTVTLNVFNKLENVSGMDAISNLKVLFLHEE
jgi:hypothetical protein